LTDNVHVLIVFILQCQKVLKQLPGTNSDKKSRNNRRFNRFQWCPMSHPHYTVTFSYRSLYMNQVPALLSPS